MLIELTDSNFDAEVLQNEKLVIVDFWAIWCAPCRALAPVVEAVAADFDGKIQVMKFDVEGGTDIPARYGIRNIPTLLFFKNGELIDKSTGILSKAALIDKINAHL